MTDWVIENNVYSGVRLIPASQFFQNYPKIKTVNVFKGNAFQREQLLRKVLASVGKPYDLFLYNCEHYTSDMLTGLPSSKQVDNFKEGFQLVAGIAAVIVFLNLFLNE